MASPLQFAGVTLLLLSSHVFLAHGLDDGLVSSSKILKPLSGRQKRANVNHVTPSPEPDDESLSYEDRDSLLPCRSCSSCPRGLPGRDGRDGQPGLTGPAGPPGNDGRDGRDASRSCTTSSPATVTAPSGDPGPPPSQSGAVLFIRWGRTVCHSASELVYAGLMSGSFYSQAGGGSNYLCLPKDPIYDQVDPGVDRDGAYIYATEYRRTERFTDTTLGQMTSHNTPCAVCLARGKSVQYMVPARNVCPSTEWTLEYKGYLFAARSDYRKTEYVCVDEDAEAVPSTSVEVGGSVMMPVESRCVSGGGLPCNPYKDGHELTCAVCTI